MEIEIRKTYHPNGNLHTEHSYLNGVQCGLQKNYDVDGKLFDLFFVKNENVNFRLK